MTQPSDAGLEPEEQATDLAGVPLWLGKLKTRLSIKEFKSLVAMVLDREGSRAVQTQLHELGATGKANAKHLLSSFEQNTYHQGRAPHLQVLGRAWLRASIRESHEKVVVQQLIPYLRETSDSSQPPGDVSSFSAILTHASESLGTGRLHDFMALCANNQAWAAYRHWREGYRTTQQQLAATAPDDPPDGAPREQKPGPGPESAGHRTTQEQLAAAAFDDPPDGALLEQKPGPGPESESATPSIRPEPLLPEVSSPVIESRELAVSGEIDSPDDTDSALSAPALLAVDAIRALGHQLARAQGMSRPLSPPSLEVLSMEEVTARAEALQHLSEALRQLSHCQAQAIKALSHDVHQVTIWLSSLGRNLGSDSGEQALQARTPAAISAAHERFVHDYEAVLSGLRQEYAALRSQLSSIEAEWSAVLELPATQIQTWQIQSQNILLRIDTAGADCLANEVRRILEHLRLERKQRELRARLEQIEQRIRRISDADKRGRCLHRLQKLRDDSTLSEELRKVRIEELEDMLPSEPAGDSPVPSVSVTVSASERNTERDNDTSPTEMPPPSARRIEKVQIQNSFFSDARTGGQKRPVLIIPPDPKPLIIPLAVEIEGGLLSASSLEITLSGEGSLFKGLSPERRSITRSIEFPAEVNRLEITLPLPLPESVRSRLSERKSPLQIRATALNQSVDLQWDALLLRTSRGELPRNPLAIASPSQDDIQRLQVGIETRLESIQEWIRSGRGHIYIAAPRRFGKTSVVDYCNQTFQQDKDLVLVRVECKPSHYGKRGQVFKSVVRALAQKLEVNEGPTCDRLDRWQDSEDDWDHLERILVQKLRHDAHQKGFQRIVVLIDEAQILFARGFVGNAYEFADRMKSFLEGIARAPATLTMAPMFMGFFGRLNLRHLFGQNLRDTFLPPTATVTELKEEEVTAVLRCINTEVDSTVSARTRLREYGINLVFLRDMFGAICDKMAAEHRIYVVRSDVDQAITSMREQRDIFQYLRDPLNRSDDTNVWQPVRGYPVAIAIASAAKGAEYVSLRTVAEHLSKLVGGETITEDLLKRILNDDELNDLVERSRDLVRIKAEPLRQFLRQQLPSDDELRHYVAELVVPDLELPPGSEIVDTGGQAELHRAISDGAEVAIRYFLPDANPVRFQREVSALKRLGQQRGPGQPGFLSLPELVKFGRAPNGRLVAIYKWVDGVSLREQIVRCQPGGLPPHVVSTVAFQIANALTIVHGQQLAHRDIKPENILFSTQGVAVLIDFGLVRDSASISSTNTVGTGLYVPPVGQGTASGDLYALARTICIMMSGSDAEQGVTKGIALVEKQFGPESANVIRRALRPDSDDRGTAKDFVRIFSTGEQRPSEFRSDRERIRVLFSGRGLNEQVRNSLTIATSFADGVGDENLRLVVGATLCCDLIDCLQRERGTHVRAIDSLLSASDELTALGLSSASEPVRLARATNQLRNGFGHWNSLEHQLATATRTVGKRDQLVPAVKKTLQAVAGLLYRGTSELDKQRRDCIQQVGAHVLVRTPGNP